MQFMPCLNPLRVLNPQTGKSHYVPCGKCSACLVSKGLSRKSKIEENMMMYPHSYFVTLTYSDSHLPLAELEDGFWYHPHDLDYKGVCHCAPYYQSDYEELCISKYGGLPVLSHKDVKDFKKRLRYYLSKEIGCYEKIYIYICGEYGPTTYRPHYHCIFSFESDELALYLRDCVYKAWSVGCEDSTCSNTATREPIGIIDFQRCTNRGSAKYVGQYLACTTHLPDVLARGDFKQFGISTRRDDTITYDELYRIFTELPVEQSCQRFGEQSSCKHPISSTSYNSVFPIASGLFSLPFDVRVFLYDAFNKFPQTNASDFARLAVEMIRPFKASHTVNDGKFFVDDIYQPKLTYTFQLLYDLYFDGDYEQFERQIYRFYCKSRTLCRNAALLKISVKQYVQQFDLWLSKFELRKLRDFYTTLEQRLTDVYSPLSLSDSIAWYYNTEDSVRHSDYYLRQFNVQCVSDFRCLSDYVEFKAKMDGILHDTTKTKKRNDDFSKNGKRHKQYAPLMSNAVRKVFNNFNLKM